MSDVEEEWTEQFGCPVEIRQIEGWNEFDVYANSEFFVTTISVAAAEDYLARLLPAWKEIA